MRLSRTFRRMAMGSVLGTGAMFVSAQALAAYEFYVTIDGTKQGKFKGENATGANRDKLVGLAIDYALQSPRDLATGMASGKRQHKPVCFVKELGAASPQLFQAITQNEVLKTVLFEFVRPGAEGTADIFHTIKLTNATVSSLKDYTGVAPGRGPQDARTLEEACFTFQKIEIENKTGKTTAADDWSVRM